MKTFQEASYEFGDEVEATATTSDGRVWLTLQQQDGEDSKKIRFGVPEGRAEGIFRLLIEAKEQGAYSLGTELAQLRITLEETEERVSLGHAKLADAIARIKRMQNRW